MPFLFFRGGEISDLSGPRFGHVLASFKTRDLKATRGLKSTTIMIAWQLGNSMLCLKKSRIWPEEFVAEIGKLLRAFGRFGKSNGNASTKPLCFFCLLCCFEHWDHMLFRTGEVSYQNTDESCVHMVF